jgi:hypothetical protein
VIGKFSKILILGKEKISWHFLPLGWFYVIGLTRHAIQNARAADRVYEAVYARLSCAGEGNRMAERVTEASARDENRNKPLGEGAAESARGSWGS